MEAAAGGTHMGLIRMNAKVFGIEYNVFTYEEIISHIAESIRSKNHITIAYSHFSILLDSVNNPEFRNILRNFSLVFPDGIGVHVAISILTGITYRRVNSTDGTREILLAPSLSATKKYFLGGDVQTAHKAKEALVAQGFDAASIYVHHGYFDDGDMNIIREINDAHADILFVGLGSPRQFEWILQQKKSLNVPVIMAIGGGIEFLAGTKARAPRWMRFVGLEWLHRLSLEPRRLWRRYSLGIPHFLFLILREKIKQR